MSGQSMGISRGLSICRDVAKTNIFNPPKLQRGSLCKYVIFVHAFRMKYETARRKHLRYRCRTCNVPCYVYTRGVRRPINVTHIALEVEIELGSFGNSCPCPDNLFALTDRYCSPFTWTSSEMYADPADPSCPFRLHYGCTLYGVAEMNMYFLASVARERAEIYKDP